MQEVTNEQEEYAQPFVDALNNLRNSDKAQQHTHIQQNNVSEYTIAGTTGATINPAITTTSATTSTILSKVGMSGGSVTYTNLGKILNVTHTHILQTHTHGCAYTFFSCKVFFSPDNLTSHTKIAYLAIKRICGISRERNTKKK